MNKVLNANGGSGSPEVTTTERFETMARTEYDKYHRLVWASERGYYNDMFVLGYLLDRVAESPDLLDGLLAESPEAIVQQLDAWAAGYPDTEDGWREWMDLELWDISSVGSGQMTEEEKYETRALVEFVRAKRAGGDQGS